MKRRDDILTELNAISNVVAAVPFVNVYEVSNNYFLTLSEAVSARIEAESFYTHQNSFAVPDGYFDNLAASVMDKIKAQQSTVFNETQSISSLVASVGNNNVYKVPHLFFENLNYESTTHSSAKVVKMSIVTRVAKYAAAAVITGLLGLGIMNITTKSTTDLPSVDNIQTADIMTDAKKIISSGNFDAALQTVSDKEIEQYLKQSGQDVNAALVASSTDDAVKLPDAGEYLLDENTLENYLKENNLNN